ncbi:hypothetical protein [Dactylosporangium matsuzakiense]|uniref:Uncharacterized protein n=1 Tax=Dactylosporangium matsuzakiense TaxID=53360 RepID=A0A9W6KGI3_9ACTN|nr:hypothetical protein [Dactylosporangium matsuzakiense]UWZ45679.1 hypothetical protein Dmats_03935 [Dactylosporangium matsuzakiense]GLL00300.1 hypothetical protein GCM10017581_020400 [Dactylosporangium matsuzakiense]
MAENDADHELWPARVRLVEEMARIRRDHGNPSYKQIESLTRDGYSVANGTAWSTLNVCETLPKEAAHISVVEALGGTPEDCAIVAILWGRAEEERWRSKRGPRRATARIDEESPLLRRAGQDMRAGRFRAAEQVLRQEFDAAHESDDAWLGVHLLNAQTLGSMWERAQETVSELMKREGILALVPDLHIRSWLLLVAERRIDEAREVFRAVKAGLPRDTPVHLSRVAEMLNEQAVRAPHLRRATIEEAQRVLHIVGARQSLGEYDRRTLEVRLEYCRFLRDVAAGGAGADRFAAERWLLADDLRAGPPQDAFLLSVRHEVAALAPHSEDRSMRELSDLLFGASGIRTEALGAPYIRTLIRYTELLLAAGLRPEAAGCVELLNRLAGDYGAAARSAAESVARFSAVWTSGS